MYCKYYHGEILREKTWFVTGCLKSHDNLVFERAIDKDNNIFEFFVPPQLESEFLHVMSYLQKNGYVLSLEEKENRFMVRYDC